MSLKNNLGNIGENKLLSDNVEFKIVDDYFDLLKKIKNTIKVILKNYQ